MNKAIIYLYKTEQYDKSIGCKYNKKLDCYMPIHTKQKIMSERYAEKLFRELNITINDLAELGNLSYSQIKELYEQGNKSNKKEE